MDCQKRRKNFSPGRRKNYFIQKKYFPQKKCFPPRITIMGVLLDGRGEGGDLNLIPTLKLIEGAIVCPFFFQITPKFFWAPPIAEKTRSKAK